MKQNGLKFDIHTKEWEKQLYKNGACKTIIGHSKLNIFSDFKL